MKTKKKYTILQFEPDDFYQFTLELVLYNMGIDSFTRISNRDGLKKIIKEIEKKQITPDIAIIDSYFSINNNDGEKIANKLRELVPNIVIVGYSIMETKSWADHEIIKSNKDQTKTLIKMLEKILDIPFSSSTIPDPEYSIS